MWVVAVAALHGSFEHFVMKRRVELRLDLAVTREAKLWLIQLQYLCRRHTRLFSIRGCNECI
jgi:hypothetical protein